MPPWLKLTQDAAEWIGLSALWVGVTGHPGRWPGLVWRRTSVLLRLMPVGRWPG
jgi:hypothetical protein